MKVGKTNIAITSVHLNWQDIALREAQIHEITAWIDARLQPNCYELLCGDFNRTPDSSVYRFLAGQQSLGGHGTTPWHDLPRHVAERTATSPAPTLDFWRNPRWQTKPTLEIPGRVDWTLVRETFEQRLPYPSLRDAGTFGTTPIDAVYPILDFPRADPPPS